MHHTRALLGDERGGYGLTLCVTPNGVKSWSQRIRIKGRYTTIGLGGYPLVTLAEAREAALASALAARAGGDPRKRKPGVPRSKLSRMTASSLLALIVSPTQTRRWR